MRKLFCLLLLPSCRCLQAPARATRSLAVHLDGLDAPVRALEVHDPDVLLDTTEELATSSGDIYGACLWPSSYVVARELVHDLSQFDEPAHIVELGCGAAALPSLAGLTAGAHSVVSCDWSELALEVVRESVERFHPRRSARVQTTRFDVRDAELASFTWTWPCTHIVCADMLYEPSAAHAVGACVAHAVSQGASALVADPGRLDGAGRAHFLLGLRSVDPDASWLPEDDAAAFVEQPVSQAALQRFGASLSWCGEKENTVGVLRLTGRRASG